MKEKRARSHSPKASTVVVAVAKSKFSLSLSHSRGEKNVATGNRGEGHLPCSAVHSIQLNLLVVNLSPREERREERERKEEDMVHLVSLSLLLTLVLGSIVQFGSESL